MRFRRTAAAAAFGLVGLLTSGCLSATTAGVLPDRDSNAGSDGPGVTEDSIKLALIFSDLGTVSASLGFNTSPQGDPQAQVDALEKWVNSPEIGGAGGRTLDLVLKVYEASEDSPENEEIFCNGITQDDKVFAVMLTGQFFSNARQCYANAQTLMLDQTLAPQSSETYDELAPYLWAPSFPYYEDFTAAYVARAVSSGFLDGAAKVGVVAPDNPVNRTVFETIVAPAIEAAGAGAPVPQWVDTSSFENLNIGVTEAINSFNPEGVDRIMFLGGERIASIFVSQTLAFPIAAKYAFTTYDSPTFLTLNPQLVPQEDLKNSPGIGFNAGGDVTNDQYPFPQTQGETECVEIFKTQGLDFTGNPQGSRNAMQFCDSVRFLKAAVDKISGPINAVTFEKAAFGLGTEFQAASAFSTEFSEGRYAGSNQYRETYLDPACAPAPEPGQPAPAGCWTYVGEPKPYSEAGA